MICAKCKASNPDNSNFCNSCGTKLEIKTHNSEVVCDDRDFLEKLKDYNRNPVRNNYPDVIQFILKYYPLIKHDYRVTENFFVFVQNDTIAYEEFLALVKKHGPDRLNLAIGYLMKNLFYWDNTKTVAASRTTLIRNYTQHIPTKNTIYKINDF